MADKKYNIKLTASDETRSAFASVKQSFDGVQAGAKNLEAPLLSVRNAIGAIAGGVIISTLKNLNDEYLQAAASSNKLAAMLQSTGYAAGITATELENLVQKTSKFALIDDDQVRDGVSALLLFRNVQGDVAKAAIRLGAEMTALGGDMSSAMSQIGAALESPIDASKKLRAMGVYVTDAQKDMIQSMTESGDVAGAQDMILDLLSRKYGDLSQTMNTGAIADAKRLTIAWGELLETMGKAPAESGFSGWLAGNLERIDATINKLQEVNGWQILVAKQLDDQQALWEFLPGSADDGGQSKEQVQADNGVALKRQQDLQDAHAAFLANDEKEGASRVKKMAEIAKFSALEVSRQRDKYEQMIAIADAADLRGQEKIQAKAERDLQTMADERDREIAKGGNIAEIQNLYLRARVARMNQAEDDIRVAAENAAHKIQADQISNNTALLAIQAAQASSRARVAMVGFDTEKAISTAHGAWSLAAEADYQYNRTAIETDAITESYERQIEAESFNLAAEIANQNARLIGLRSGSDEYAYVKKQIDEATLLAQMDADQKVVELEYAKQRQLRELKIDGESAQTDLMRPAAELDAGAQEGDRYAMEMESYRAYAATHQSDAQANSIILQNIEKQHQDKLQALLRSGQLSALQFEKLSAENKKQLMIGSLGQMMGALGAHNKGMFEANKLYSKGKLVVDVASAVGEHMKLPFPMNAIQVATDLALGATQFAAINSAQFGGGSMPSGAGASGGGGSMPSIAAPAYPSPSAPAAPQAAPAVTQNYYTIVGAKENPDKAVLSYNAMLELTKQQNDAASRGHVSETHLIAG